MKISVIVPTYNHARFLPKTLRSILNQSHQDLEIIVIDDGSTDRTRNIVKGFGPDIKYIRQRNRGVSSARNTGIAVADGDLLAFLDADDIWQTRFLEETSNLLLEAPQFTVAYSWWSYIDAEGLRLPEVGRRSDIGDLLSRLAIGNIFPPSSAIVRAQAVQNCGGYSSKFSILADWDLWLRIAKNGGRFGCVQTSLVQYRVHESNMSSDYEREMDEREVVLDSFFNGFDLPSEITSLAPQAYAKIRLNAGLRLFGLGEIGTASQEIAKASFMWPEILMAEETYYRLICAEQPLGYRHPSQIRTLDRVQGQIRDLLGRLSEDPEVGPMIKRSRRKMQSTANLALAKFHYIAGSRRSAVKLIGRSFILNPLTLSESQYVSLFVRSILGRERVRAIRNMVRPLRSPLYGSII